MVQRLIIQVGHKTYKGGAESCSGLHSGWPQNRGDPISMTNIKRGRHNFHIKGNRIFFPTELDTLKKRLLTPQQNRISLF